MDIVTSDTVPDTLPPPYSFSADNENNVYETLREPASQHSDTTQPATNSPAIGTSSYHEGEDVNYYNNQYPAFNNQSQGFVPGTAASGSGYLPAYSVASGQPNGYPNYYDPSIDQAQAAKYFEDTGYGYPGASVPSLPLGPNSSAYPGMYATTPSGGLQPVVVVSHRVPPPPSAVPAYVLSCTVLWLCNIVFGCIAFWFAYAASTAGGSGDYVKARKRIKVSVTLSIIGIGVSFILIIILAAALS